ncbi:hypothetical protein RN001_013677 [Aquatica leii]|uniref:Tyr recombinase domain-containing protein n=1 Tax=Aquatica leii TaxID=1421715 RepID=A0AAN7P0D1_9COLE|nr:hypothetical protein RN001_013677 [Aquatica leii]
MEGSCTPPEFKKTAAEVMNSLLPAKSKAAYEKEYNAFNIWCTQNKASISENVMLVYFKNLSENKKPSTLWSTYSKLKSCINIENNIDISKYNKLITYLKRLSEGFQPKKSKVLEAGDIDRFLRDADDHQFLAIKVGLIMGYAGACRREELMTITVNDLKFNIENILISIPKTKNNMPRLFAITEQNWINLIKKYYALRPKNCKTERFFLTYRNGYCINSPIGINTIGNMPKVIATFLNLNDPGSYTGHCFRRSSATHLANNGGDLVTIKRHGGWKSGTVAEGYIETSLGKKIQIADMLAQPSTSTANLQSANASQSHDNHNVEIHNNDKNVNISTQNPGIHVEGKDSCTINIKVFNNCNFSNPTE